MSEKPEIQINSVISRDKDLVFTESDGEIVMLSIEKGVYYSLDVVGSFIWETLQEPAQVSEICDRLLQEYEVDTETCSKEVLNFLNSLYRESLIKLN